MKKKKLIIDKTPKKVTLDSPEDEIYSFDDHPVPPHLAKHFAHIEQPSTVFNIDHKELLIHEKLRNKVFEEILPALEMYMNQHNDVDVELEVETNYPESSIRIILSSYGGYAIKTEGNLISLDKSTPKHSADYFEIDFKSKVAFISYISTQFAREEMQILLTICEYFKKVHDMNKKAEYFIRTI